MRTDLYTAEQEAFLFEHHASCSRTELADKFNQRFHTNKTPSAIKSWCNRRGLSAKTNPTGHLGRKTNAARTSSGIIPTKPNTK